MEPTMNPTKEPIKETTKKPNENPTNKPTKSQINKLTKSLIKYQMRKTHKIKWNDIRLIYVSNIEIWNMRFFFFYETHENFIRTVSFNNVNIKQQLRGAKLLINNMRIFFFYTVRVQTLIYGFIFFISFFHTPKYRKYETMFSSICSLFKSSAIVWVEVTEKFWWVIHKNELWVSTYRLNP